MPTRAALRRELDAVWITYVSTNPLLTVLTTVTTTIPGETAPATSTASAAGATASTKRAGLSNAAIGGAAIGSILGFVILLVLLFCCCRRRETWDGRDTDDLSHKRASSSPPPIPPPPPPAFPAPHPSVPSHPADALQPPRAPPSGHPPTGPQPGPPPPPPPPPPLPPLKRKDGLPNPNHPSRATKPSLYVSAKIPGVAKKWQGTVQRGEKKGQFEIVTRRRRPMDRAQRRVRRDRSRSVPAVVNVEENRPEA